MTQEKKPEDKTIVIHQPDFMPYLGYFDRLLHADTLVVLETAQYVNGTSKSWMNRDKIKTDRGEQWFNLCVKKAPRETAIKDIELLDDGGKWRKNNLGLFHQHYRKAPFYKEILPYVEELYARDDKLFWTFAFASIKMLMNLFDIHTEVVFATDLDPQGKNNDMIVDIMQKLGAHRYLSGTGAADYYDESVYKKAEIEVIWQDFHHPKYPQQYPELGFIPYLSSLDLLFNCGIENSRKILRGER
ncbi:MAG: hypothetical protein E7300_09535 [Lachnospiraceae bacterium]|nr:hypothetical protein [Lachnospiraceae bacterium]